MIEEEKIKYLAKPCKTPFLSIHFLEERYFRIVSIFQRPFKYRQPMDSHLIILQEYTTELKSPENGYEKRLHAIHTQCVVHRTDTPCYCFSFLTGKSVVLADSRQWVQ